MSTNSETNNDEEVMASIVCLINAMVAPKAAIQLVSDLKDGQYLCLLIMKCEYNPLLDITCKDNQQMSGASLDDIDLDVVRRYIPHKIYSVIEKFIKKFFGFDYTICHHFKSGQQKYVKDIAVLVLSIAYRSASYLIRPFVVQFKNHFTAIITESYSVLKAMRQKFDPFCDLFLNDNTLFDVLFSQSIESNQKRPKTLRIQETQQIFKLLDTTKQMGLRKTLTKTSGIDNQLKTTIKLIVSYSQTFALNESLKLIIETNLTNNS